MELKRILDVRRISLLSEANIEELLLPSEKGFSLVPWSPSEPNCLCSLENLKETQRNKQQLERVLTGKYISIKWKNLGSKMEVEASGKDLRRIWNGTGFVMKLGWISNETE